jgi:galactokinase
MSRPPTEQAVDERRARIEAVLGEGGPPSWFRAPGRVNLMGDHTDYNEGFVLPVAIDRECLIAARPRADGWIIVRSLDVEAGEEVRLHADGSDEPGRVKPPWGRYVAGVVRELVGRGWPKVGADAALSSTVPRGSGLSSSAALEVACAVALCGVAGFELPARELALACQHAELIATGVPCGIMDQLASLEGVTGAALLIDCRSLEVEPVPLPSGLRILVIHSGVARTLADSVYAKRRAACEAAASALGLRALRDASPEQVADEPCARHVVSENARVLETAQALRQGDLDCLGPLYTASQASLRDDYRVSTPELDALVTALAEVGAHGARLTGAGFGGCVVALVPEGREHEIAASATERYRLETALRPTSFLCSAVSGAGPLYSVR